MCIGWMLLLVTRCGMRQRIFDGPCKHTSHSLDFVGHARDSNISALCPLHRSSYCHPLSTPPLVQQVIKKGKSKTLDAWGASGGMPRIG